MSDDQTPVTPDSQPDNDGDNKLSSEAPSIDELRAQMAEMQEHIKTLNAESAARRVENKKLQEERDALKAAQLEKLEQEGNYKAIAEERAKKLAEMETYQQRAQALEDTIRQANEARIAQIPEHMRSVVPTDYPPEKLATWLDNNATVLARPTQPDLGAGVAGGNGANVKLTPAQVEMAKRFGMTSEEYAKALQKMNGSS